MRSDRQRLTDIVVAADAIAAHQSRGAASTTGSCTTPFASGSSRSAKRSRTPTLTLLESEAAIPWAAVARMRDRLAHRYFDTDHSIVAATVEEDLPHLVAAVKRLLEHPDRST